MAKVLIVGASGGIGSALAAACERRGDTVTRLSRRENGLELTDPASVEQHVGRLDGPFDLIIIATGALAAGGHPPEKSLGQIDASALAAQFAVNAIGPALILRHIPRLLSRDSRSVCVALSARVGSIGDNRLGGWYGYRAAKAALNQILRTCAIELARTHPRAVCVALHPGTVRTPLTDAYLDRHPAVAPDEAAGNLLSVISALSASDSGSHFDWSGKPIPW